MILSGEQIIERGIVLNADPSQVRPYSIRLTMEHLTNPASSVYETHEIIDTTGTEGITGIFSPMMAAIERGMMIQAPIWDSGYGGLLTSWSRAAKSL